MMAVTHDKEVMIMDQKKKEMITLIQSKEMGAVISMNQSREDVIGANITE
jgi:hypothetical protein